MGQKVSFQVGFQEYTPDTKPLKKEVYPSIEKPKNKNEDNELNERESEKVMQNKLGINVIKKHSEMPMKMESFIIDTIIVEKLKHSGNGNETPIKIKIAEAIRGKLNDKYGSGWNVLITNPKQAAMMVTSKIGTLIFLKYDSCNYAVFKSG